MKHEQDLNLKQAFSPMPDECYHALMHTARSLKEEEPMKRAAFRTILIVVLIIIATTTMALAASRLGLMDLLKNQTSVALPQNAQNILAKTKQTTHEVGPLTITLQETLADGRLIYTNTQAKSADPALFFSMCCDAGDPIPEELAKFFSLSSELTYLEAAKVAHLPLYRVFSYLETDSSYLEGDEMMDAVFNDQGEMLLIDLLQTHPDRTPDTIQGTLVLRVQQIDPDSGETMEGKDWRMEKALEIPVQGMIAEKTYQAGETKALRNYTLQDIRAEQTCAGVYITASFRAEASVDPDDVHCLYDHLEIRDAAGNPYPRGVSFSGMVDRQSWPVVRLGWMLGVDQIPETMVLTETTNDTYIFLK